MGRLEGRVALITGGASGIGRACAELFAGEGADVLVSDINEAGGAETVAAVEALGQRAAFIRTDTRVEAENEAMAQAGVDQLGRLDICVAAAGVSHASYDSGNAAPDEELMRRRYQEPDEGLITNRPVEMWEKVIDINLTGVMLTNRAAARQMMALGNGGSIINISSIAGRHPGAGSPEYCVSKAGVWMLSKSFALEFARFDIRVNAIGPGFIETPMTAVFRADESVKQRWMAMTPMGRFGLPMEVANAALFLASDESSFYTGQILHPDGGVFTG
jgi:NAD(P)-dependent dehydrogenase (short-subunit alcohol dehydrogenase family)